MDFLLNELGWISLDVPHHRTVDLPSVNLEAVGHMEVKAICV